MSLPVAPLDSNQRQRILAQFAGRPPGEELLAHVVVLDGVPLGQALRATVGDLDPSRRRLILCDKRGHRSSVLFDDAAASLATTLVGSRSSAEPLFVGRSERPLAPDRARRLILDAAERAGVPASLPALRPSSLVPA